MAEQKVNDVSHGVSFEKYGFDPEFLQAKMYGLCRVANLRTITWAYKSLSRCLSSKCIPILNDLCDRRLGAFFYITHRTEIYFSRPWVSCTQNIDDYGFICVCTDEIWNQIVHPGLGDKPPLVIELVDFIQKKPRPARSSLSKLTLVEKTQFLKEWNDRNIFKRELTHKYGVSYSTLRSWANKLQS